MTSVTVLGLAASITLTAPQAAAPAVSLASCGGQAPTITGTSGGDVITGTPGPDVIAGLAGDDTLRGLGGDDIMCGGDGSDLLVGGAGDDALYGGRSAFHSDRAGTYYIADTFRPGPGSDLVNGGVDPRAEPGEEWMPDTLDYSAAPQAIEVDLAAGTADGEGHDQIAVGARWGVVGSTFDDLISGSPFDDVLEGGHGADTIDGGAGNDSVTGDSATAPDGASDILSGSDGNDELFTGGGPDQLSGGAGNDRLFDRDGAADVLHGGEGDDILQADLGGRDQLYGDAGDDDLYDHLTAGAGQVVDGGQGTNSITLLTRFIRDQTEQRVSGTTDLRDGVTTVEGPEVTTATVQNASSLSVPARWTVWGTDAAEIVRGAYDGPITVHAGGGNDRLVGTVYIDVLDGGDGTDYARPGKGDDTCISIEQTNLPDDACDETGVVGPAELASVSADGTQADRAFRWGYQPAISAGGRYIVFTTTAALVPRDTNGVSDVYLRDRKADLTSRVSVTSRGRQLTRASLGADISADGRYVVFVSRGAAVDGLTPGPARIFLRDRGTGRTTLMSVNNRGRPANSASFSPSISADGSRVAFLSYADNMGGRGVDVYVRDRAQRTTILVTVRRNGTPSRSEAYAPSISSNGRFVLFASDDPMLSASDRDGLFARDLHTRQTEWVDHPAGYYQTWSISADGRLVAFTQLDPQCAGRDFDCTVVKVRNRDTGRLQTASVTPDGHRPDGASAYPVLSGDGRFVLFTSWARNLLPEDTNFTADVFVRDLRTGITTLVSTDRSAGPADGPSGSLEEAQPGVAFSDNGAWIAFESAATDLVDSDTNGMADVFVRSWQAPQ